MASSDAYPAPNGTKSFWRTVPHNLDTTRTTKDLPIDADIVIIGAGYCGASLAYHLTEHSGSQKLRIVILEAREACSGASGRNGGHLKPDPYNKALDVLDSHGRGSALGVCQFEQANLDAVRDFIERDNVDCDFELTKAMDVCLDEASATIAQERLRRAEENGLISQKHVVGLFGEEAAQVSGVKGAKSCISYPAAHLWPYKLVTHLLANAVRRGVNLQTFTPVHSIVASKDSRWKIKTARGFVHTRAVIHASNAFAATLLPEFRNQIVPVRGICARLAPGAHFQPRKKLVNSYSIRFNSWEHDYLIPRADGSIIVGGARRDYLHNLESWFNVSDDSQVTHSAAPYFDGYMQRLFDGWGESDASTQMVWSGIMGYSSDGFPHVGRVPNKLGQFICAGFSGHGMPQGFLCAKELARMITTGAEIAETLIPKLYQASWARCQQKTHATLQSWKKIDWRIKSRL